MRARARCQRCDRRRVQPRARGRVRVPGDDGELARRVIGGVRRELEAGLPTFALALGRSRVATDPADLYRAAAEALLAVNVAQAQGVLALNFEETGAYRLLL